MRSPGVVYRRYRQLRKKLLYDKVSEAKRVCHKNCHYGKTFPLVDMGDGNMVVRLCMYDIMTETGIQPDFCTDPQSCNAFASKWTKGKVVEEFEAELADYDKKRHLYPELTVLEWILDRDLNIAMREPNVLGKLLVWTIQKLESALKSVGGSKKDQGDPK